MRERESQSEIDRTLYLHQLNLPELHSTGIFRSVSNGQYTPQLSSNLKSSEYEYICGICVTKDDYKHDQRIYKNLFSIKLSIVI